MKKVFLIFTLLLSCYWAKGQTVASLSLSPQGFTILADGTSPVTITALCTYVGGSPAPDNCSAGGGVTWSSPSRALQPSNGGQFAGGVIKWSLSYPPAGSLFAGAQTAQALVHACAQSQCDNVKGLADPITAISNISLTSNVVTLTVNNSPTTVGAGQIVSFVGLTTLPALNGQLITLTSADATTLTFPFTHADISSTIETGDVAIPLNVYTTPSLGAYQNIQPGTYYTPSLVIGSTMAVGAGFTYSHGGNGNPFQFTCNWSSSDNTKATITRYGLATAVGVGAVTFTCGQAGNGIIDNSFGETGLTFGPINITSPTPTLQIWYVRPDGGTPYVNGTQTPAGQCDGLHDASYASTGGTGVNQPCAVGNLAYLWMDQVTHNSEKWMIGPGDQVIVRQGTGYNIGLNQLSPAFGGSVTDPVNCGNPDCYMPSIPSGTAAHHTRILGENYASCANGVGGTLLYVSWASKFGFNLEDSQYVDVQCFEVTDQAACAYGNGFTANCQGSSLDYGVNGARLTGMTGSDNIIDINYHGLAAEGYRGATGANLLIDRNRIQVPYTGFDTDDLPHNLSNISVAGGLTMNDTVTEFVGCIETYPVVLHYPYSECRDQPNGQGDGFGTANTTGSFSFNNDIWRYNFQDGLDLLHAESQFLSVTNSQSYGNIGNSYKLGPAETVIFQNNLSISNCFRVTFLFGDEPSSGIGNVNTPCRAGGGNLIFTYFAYGTVDVQNNNLLGYGAGFVGSQCDAGSDNCSTTNTLFQNNYTEAWASTNPFNGFANPTMFCTLDIPLLSSCNHTLGDYPPNIGWTTRTNNLYSGIFPCPGTLNTGETCNTLTPGTSVAPSSPITNSQSGEEVVDPFNIPASYNGTYLVCPSCGWYMSSGSSSIATGGTPIAGLTLDAIGYPYDVSNPSIGPLQFQSGMPTVVDPTCTPGAGTYTSSQSVTCSSTTPSSTTYCTINGSTPTTSSPVCTAISVITTLTLRAISTAVGFTNSSIPSFGYIITSLATPTRLKAVIIKSGKIP